MFGSPETTTGGNALKFYASVRLDVRKIETLTKGTNEDAIGNLVRVKVVKNKVAPPFRKAEMEIIFGKGVSYEGSLLDAAVKYEIINKSGSWYSYGEERIGQGKDNTRDYLAANPKILQEVELKVRTKIFPHKYPANGAPAVTVKKEPGEKVTTKPAPVPKSPAKALVVEESGGDELF